MEGDIFANGTDIKKIQKYVGSSWLNTKLNVEVYQISVKQPLR